MEFALPSVLTAGTNVPFTLQANLTTKGMSLPKSAVPHFLVGFYIQTADKSMKSWLPYYMLPCNEDKIKNNFAADTVTTLDLSDTGMSQLVLFLLIPYCFIYE